MSDRSLPPIDSLLSARGLRKSYRRGPERVHAVLGVDLDVRVGEVVGVMGPSGSGKTTLLNVLGGWEQPDRGTVTWRGGSVRLRELPWTDSAFIPQDLALLEELPVGENIALPVRLGGRLAAQTLDRIGAVVEALGLADLTGRMPAELSLGEQQRAALGRALVAEPALVLADEPTAHQDEAWGKQLMMRVREAARRGTAFMIATHDPEILGHLDRVLTMADGRVVAG